MAGSYEHILDGWSMIENMGDAHEAVEELMWLVEHLISQPEAKFLLDTLYHPMKRGELSQSKALKAVIELMNE